MSDTEVLATAVKIGSVVELNDTEQRLARFVAASRTANNRGSGIFNGRRSEESDQEVDLHSFGAELAFAKLFNVYPDLSICLRSVKTGSDHGDAVLDGKRVDVKQTKYVKGRLLAIPDKKASVVDAYALVVGEFPKYTFRGFMRATDLIADKRLGDLGRGPAYLAEQHELVEWGCLNWPMEK